GAVVSLRPAACASRRIHGDRLMRPHRPARAGIRRPKRTFWPFWLALGLALPVAPADDVLAAELSYEFHAERQEARAWLAARGFELKLDADNPARSRLVLGSKGLTIETLASAEPLIARAVTAIPQPARLVVTWGVDR